MKDSSALPFINSVLYATDFSPSSQRAFAHALALAVLRNADLTLLHVGPESEDEVDWRSFPQVRQTLENWGLLAPGSPQAAVLEKLNVSVYKIALRNRHPVLAAADYLARVPHDVVVLATQGREGIGRWIERSKAEAIARRSNAMTLFVPDTAKRSLIALDTGDITFRNVLVPVDKTPSPGAAVVIAQRAADLLGDKPVMITLLHVGERLPVLPELPESSQWSWQNQCISGEPVEQILSKASQTQADLIVMATAGTDGLMDAFRGSTSEQVVRQADCPVLVVPADWAGTARN